MTIGATRSGTYRGFVRRKAGRIVLAACILACTIPMAKIAVAQSNPIQSSFAQDPDGDRLAIVDENGKPLGEDFTLTLGIQQVLGSHGKGPVAVNLSSGKTVDYVAEQVGEQVTRTKIGEINVSETMLKSGLWPVERAMAVLSFQPSIPVVTAMSVWPLFWKCWPTRESQFLH